MWMIGEQVMAEHAKLHTYPELMDVAACHAGCARTLHNPDIDEKTIGFTLAANPWSAHPHQACGRYTQSPHDKQSW